MPIRFVVEGQQYEVDTPDEAVHLRKALSSSHSENGHRRPGRPKKSHPEAPQPTQILNPKVKRLREVVFFAEDMPFINALLANPNGVNTDEVMNLLSITNPQSVPPRFTTWRLRAKKHGFKFNDVLTRKEKYISGKVRSVYKLTPLGRELLAV
jgi:hypothetical protein